MHTFKHIPPGQQQPKVYLVGGAVRDKYLHRKVLERDWLVVNATSEIMRNEGFQCVGKQFPVFLHPTTQEEYALARTERKTGRGYTGFACNAHPDVTLEEDLKRRDLTINAMAEVPISHKLIDPYHGLQDLQEGILRHVSPAFSEDPLRVLRVARFASMLPNFQVHHTTLELMRKMVKMGELADLVVERVIVELHKALNHPACYRFFQVLSDCQALHFLFPGLSMGHKLENCLNHVNPDLEHLSLKQQIHARFAVIFHTLSHQNRQQLYQRYPIPKQSIELTELVATYAEELSQLPSLSPDAQLHLIYSTDALRRSERFEQLLCISQGMHSRNQHDNKLVDYAHRLMEALKTVDKSALLQQDPPLRGQAFKVGLLRLQREVIQQFARPDHDDSTPTR